MRASELRRLETLEHDYRDLLLAALRDCAAGCWGLLGANDDCQGAAAYRPAVVDELLDRGAQIDALRSRAGLEDLPLHQRLLNERALRGANLPGEPKRATAWLAEIARLAGS